MQKKVGKSLGNFPSCLNGNDSTLKILEIKLMNSVSNVSLPLWPSDASVAQASPLWMHASPPQDTFISLVGHFETNTQLLDMTDAGKEFLCR